MNKEIDKDGKDKERPNPADYHFIDLYGEIAIKSDGQIAGEQFTVEKCKECCILLLDHLASVNIDDCEECLIVTGPCSGSVFIRDCKNTTLFTICQQFRSRDCTNTDVFLFCATKPIIESSKLMRFRSLALSYNKLEAHIMKASLSPFTNYWNSIHDFTPEDIPNFEICLTEYDKIKKMSMVENIGSVKFNPELSVLSLYTIANEVTGKKMLILCMERNKETLVSFYGRILKFLRDILARGAQLIATRDIIIRKKECPSLFISKKQAQLSGQKIPVDFRKLSFAPLFKPRQEIKLWERLIGDHPNGRLITLEIACNREQIEESVRMVGDMMEIVEDSDFEHLRTNLYQFAQMQTDIS
uniref:Protein XRP2 n=1 Tax=Elaeophora elaphi TaxID=1147741 RepID=A0A0R3S0Y2_9BILA